MAMSIQGVTLVIGAGTQLGWHCIENLFKDNHKIRAVDKSQDKLNKLKKRLSESGHRTEIETHVIDLMRPDTLNQIFKDVHRVLVILPNNPERETLAKNLFEVMKKEGKDRIENVLLMSVYGARNRDITIQKQLYNVEELLKATNLPYTNFGPVVFQETITHYFADQISRGELCLPVHDENARLCFVAIRELAECVRCVMKEPQKHRGQCYQFTGPDLFTGKELARLFTEAVGKQVSFKAVQPNETMEHFMRAGGWTKDQAMNIVEFIQWQSVKGHLDEVSEDSKKLGVRSYHFKDLIQEERHNLQTGKNLGDSL